MPPFVLKGLRLLPWLQEAARREPDNVGLLLDCETCMQTLDPLNRQMIGCGLLPTDPRVPVRPWDHVGRRPGREERDADGRVHLPICPGYLCGLPEVSEVASAHAHWSKGQLSLFCDGKRVSPNLLDAVMVLEGEYGRVIDWASRQKKTG